MRFLLLAYACYSESKLTGSTVATAASIRGIPRRDQEDQTLKLGLGSKLDRNSGKPGDAS